MVLLRAAFLPAFLFKLGHIMILVKSLISFNSNLEEKKRKDVFFRSTFNEKRSIGSHSITFSICEIRITILWLTFVFLFLFHFSFGLATWTMWEMRKSTNAQGQTPRRGTCEFRSQYNHNAKVKDIRLFRPYRNLEASQHSVYTTNTTNQKKKTKHFASSSSSIFGI